MIWQISKASHDLTWEFLETLTRNGNVRGTIAHHILGSKFVTPRFQTLRAIPACNYAKLKNRFVSKLPRALVLLYALDKKIIYLIL